jgi:adenine-specific DNA-methyltransferase
LREVFFIKIKDCLVFNASKFIGFINNKEFLPDSYTAFSNTIGLVNRRGDFISDSNEVVLSFPFKDGVLA